jgi:Tfp pilus assembly protein PilF
LQFQLGVVLLEQGKPSQALAYLERALELEPDHQASLLNSAIVLQEMAASNDKDVSKINNCARHTQMRKLALKNNRFFHLL